MLGVHSNTVYDWCQKAIEGRPTKLRDVQQHPVTGYYAIDLEEVKSLKEKKP
jgi:hypothetical protein